jgi:GNAT superfamily N-acetyltransferase
MMFKIKLMHPEDFSFATELANTMDWNMAPEDFQFMSQLEPEGCLVLFDDSKPIGIATCISYGKMGWFGNLIVKKEIRHRGAGSLLVKHAINYLQSKGVETIGLYAYPNLLNFYGNFGFKADESFVVLQAQTINSSRTEPLPEIGKLHFQAISKFDKDCFGGDRAKLLESIILEQGNLGYYLSNCTGVVGFIAATVYETMAWVGPLMCKEGNVDEASKLLKGVVGKLSSKKVFVALPRKETTLTDLLSVNGFKEVFSVVRMYLGSNAARNCIYLAESLERG